MAAAQDVPGCRDDAVGALPARQAGILFDPVNRKFGGAAEDRKDGAIFEEIDGVIAPFTGRNLAAVETENAIKLAAVERHLACGGGRAHLAPAPRARLDFAEVHAAPPLPEAPCMEASPAFHDRAGAMRRQEPFRTDRPCAPVLKSTRCWRENTRCGIFDQ